MIIRATDGIRGTLVDMSTHRIIRKPIWANLATGEYEAYQLDQAGEVHRDRHNKPITYRSQAPRLHFTPAVPITPQSSESSTAPALRSKTIRKDKRLMIPLLNCPCQHKGCDRLANWYVSDEIALQPVVVGKKRYSQAKTVAQRLYCDFHYQPPRLLDHKGEVIKEFEDAGGVRPQWHS